MTDAMTGKPDWKRRATWHAYHPAKSKCGKGQGRCNAWQQQGMQMTSTPRVGVFDLVRGSGTRRFNRLVVTGFLLVREFLPNRTPDRIKALFPIVLLLSQASAIPHAEFMQRKLGVYG